MSSTTATLPDDAFRSYVLDFLRHVPPAALNNSDAARSELEALTGEFYETSQDINMQELIFALHVRYDLVGLGFFEKAALDEILVRVNKARGKTGTKNRQTTAHQTPTVAQQGPVAPDEVAEDLVGVASQFSAVAPVPADLDPKDLDPAEEEDNSARLDDGPGEDYVVGWRTEFLMTPDGTAMVYRQLQRQRGRGGK
ncbi:uncharacterized protein Z520_07087 [Fonsecaea multimorphosa CBS 102226]|uniref:Uncharacterized protein n=1 Tax=Fonsecaea multimorphosa CBS 102226 TaxID=1442371 RepID=A0A0D2KK52_9EURO|nr:uncharacterized protein Z520_07087 [Fonsecaea multimorphosa CBS 102226]KIX96973.1 hypothetical protein Z520_07087 [Fonsecaea multimorphosa CBS 102226]OAL23050.1 hypothetical protein AYO22_06664 [Fonsecaea multimorphosa]